jgi:hypothetical protein
MRSGGSRASRPPARPVAALLTPTARPFLLCISSRPHSQPCKVRATRAAGAGGRGVLPHLHNLANVLCCVPPARVHAPLGWRAPPLPV